MIKFLWPDLLWLLLLLPLLVALGASTETDTLQRVGGEVLYGVLSMDSYLWAPLATA